MSTQVIVSLRHLFGPGSSPRDNALALHALLNCLVALNVAHLTYHREVPLFNSGVYYGRTKEWEPIPEMYARGYGDCKSLSAALIAEYRMRGIPADPVFRFMVLDQKRVNEYARLGVRRIVGETDFHILVQTPQGYEDPSKILGMGKDENMG